MKGFFTKTVLAVFAGSLALSGVASADNYGHHRDRGGWHDNGRHNGWDRGHRDHDRWDNDRWDGDRYDRHDRWDRRDHRRYDRGYNRGYNSGWRDRSEWRRGGYVSRYDYDRGYYVDYRSHRRLYAPPRGYEWRRVDDNYVMVAVATGLIAALILSD